MAFVDKLASDNSGLKQLLLRQDLSDKTVKAKRMKTKDSNETVPAFLVWLQKMLGSKRAQKQLESSKNFAKLKE